MCKHLFKRYAKQKLQYPHQNTLLAIFNDFEIHLISKENPIDALKIVDYGLDAHPC